MKKIDGSWFEFQHMNKAEGKYWNKECANFTENMWKEKIKEMSELKMEYIVLMASALDGKTFYKSNHFPSFEINCKNCLDILFQTADRYNMKVFVGNDFVGDWRNPKMMIRDPLLIKKRDILTAEIAERYSHHKSFYGWYWPNEAEINPYYCEDFIEYVNYNSRLVDSLTPGKKKLIAPYGTCKAKTDDRFVKQLDKLDVDYIAYQDEVGVKKTRVEDTYKWFENLRNAHDKSGRSEIWADVEIFDFEGEVYESALIESNLERISKQIDNVSTFVEKILVYQYLGMMNKPGSIAKTGNRKNEEYYKEYHTWLKRENII